MVGSDYKVLSACSVYAGRSRLSLDATMDGLRIKAYDKATGSLIGVVDVESGEFTPDTPTENKVRVSAAVHEAITKGYGFSQRATNLITSHPSWETLSASLSEHSESALVAS